MAGEKGQRGPLVAAYEYSMHSVGRNNLERERIRLVDLFSNSATGALDYWGLPVVREEPLQIKTPEVTLETGRGDVIVSLKGIKDGDGRWESVSLDTRYGEFKSPFTPPDKPIKPSSVEVVFRSGKALNDEFNSPKIKRLRRALAIIRVLKNEYDKNRDKYERAASS